MGFQNANSANVPIDEKTTMLDLISVGPLLIAAGIEPQRNAATHHNIEYLLESLLKDICVANVTVMGSRGTSRKVGKLHTNCNHILGVASSAPF